MSTTTQLADAPTSPVANRAARYLVLVGAFELALWFISGIIIAIELAIDQTSALSRSAALLLWSLGHALVGLLALLLCACPQLLTLWFFFGAAIVLAAIDIFEVVVRAFDFVDEFPLIGVFAFIYAAFNLFFLVAAVALAAFSWRAARRYFGWGTATTFRSSATSSVVPLFDSDDSNEPKKRQ